MCVASKFSGLPWICLPSGPHCVSIWGGDARSLQGVQCDQVHAMTIRWWQRAWNTISWNLWWSQCDEIFQPYTKHATRCNLAKQQNEIVTNLQDRVLLLPPVRVNLTTPPGRLLLPWHGHHLLQEVLTTPRWSLACWCWWWWEQLYHSLIKMAISLS